MPDVNEEAEKGLVSACEDLRWRDRQDGMERMLCALSWWLDTKEQNSASLTIAGVQREFEFNREATSVLEHILKETDAISAEDLLEQWGKLKKADDDTV